MSPVFSHGRLRLYLLKLLDESPRHGYDMIRLLEDRFMGLYAPSPGTIYPRLQRLEAEGLVTQSQEGGRKVYQITEAGREELRRRQEELDQLETEIGSSVSGLAREIRDEVHGTVRDLKQELRQAAREIRREQRHENRWRRAEHGWDYEDDHHRGSRREDDDAPAGRLQGRLREFLARTDQVLKRAGTTEAQLRECAAILDEAFERIRQTLREPR
ncbi:MAG TPA: PadR family transcriptional regulator [Actinomycetota bacterium]|nr:PadR family transcriptional regulator [Actinomycetota bacterium]